MNNYNISLETKQNGNTKIYLTPEAKMMTFTFSFLKIHFLHKKRTNFFPFVSACHASSSSVRWGVEIGKNNTRDWTDTSSVASTLSSLNYCQPSQ